MSAPVEPSVEVDVLVVGAGVAGASVALGLAGVRRVLLRRRPGRAAPGWAQGGIAAAVAGDDDPADHARDTEIAGAGLCDPTRSPRWSRRARARRRRCSRRGARCDRDADGRLALGSRAATAAAASSTPAATRPASRSHRVLAAAEAPRR